MHGARLAKRLGFKRTTVIEFGVAGGAGLVAAEAIAQLTERETGVAIDIIGFDMGSGMPVPRDYRDLPYHWKPGYFKMDEAALRSMLNRAEVVLGPIAETMSTTLTIEKLHTSPISSIFFDVDYYSSTLDALKVFGTRAETRLPRVMCYMDDIVGELEDYSDYTGARGAIADFNRANENMKLSPLYLGEMPDSRLRASQLMMLHDFSHHHYNTFVGDEIGHGQLPL